MRRKLREAKDVTIPQVDEIGIMCWLSSNYEYSAEVAEADAVESIEPIDNVPAHHLHCVPKIYEL